MWDRDSDGQQATIRRVLGYSRRVAVVGLSARRHRASFGVATTLRRHGYEVVAVNPNLEHWLDLPAYPSLADVPGDIDLVDVFRREEHLDDIARQVIERGGVRGLWLQEDLRSTEARRLATTAGIDYVEDRCLGVEVALHADAMDFPA